VTYYVVDSVDELVEPLAIFFDKEEAYDSLKNFCSVRPQGWIEVLTEDEYLTMLGA
jgi:dihydroorotase